MKEADEFLRILQKVRRADGNGSRILLAAHVRPDGDAVGSLCAAACVLYEAGYNVRAVLPPETVPDSCRAFVPPGLTVPSVPADAEYGLFISLDCSNEERVAASEYPFRTAPLRINIDHHPDNSGNGDLVIVDPKASSTAELLFRLFRACALPVSRNSATLLLLGVVTDSGCFRFDNTTPDTLETAGTLLALGADRHGVITAAYASRDLNLVRLEAELVSRHLGLAHGNRTAYLVLTRALLAEFNVDVRNTESLIDAVRNIAGVEFAAILREEDGGYKLSLRTKNAPYSAGRVARRLNGGGHEMAAGGFIPAASAEEAVRILTENIEMEWNEHETQNR